MELADFREILVKIRILTVDLVELLGKFECTSGRVSSNEESEIPQIFRLRRFQWNFSKARRYKCFCSPVFFDPDHRSTAVAIYTRIYLYRKIGHFLGFSPHFFDHFRSQHLMTFDPQ